MYSNAGNAPTTKSEKSQENERYKQIDKQFLCRPAKSPYPLLVRFPGFAKRFSKDCAGSRRTESVPLPASVPVWGPGSHPILYIVPESAPAAQESVLEHVLWGDGLGGEVVLGSDHPPAPTVSPKQMQFCNCRSCKPRRSAARPSTRCRHMGQDDI